MVWQGGVAGASAMTQLTATMKKLRQLARACAKEADVMEAAADLIGGALHRKNARVWRGRSRTCWQAVTLLGRG